MDAIGLLVLALSAANLVIYLRSRRRPSGSVVVYNKADGPKG